ncbi:MAG: choice-of-anchor tandem repeat GloVer-containing protein, partial [Rhizomicrobium sp.]
MRSEQFSFAKVLRWSSLFRRQYLFRCGLALTLFVPLHSVRAATETVLYSFCSQANCTDGSSPDAGLIMDSAGNLYGTTSLGGANIGSSTEYSEGTVFKVEPGGTETVLYSFCSQTNCTDGATPQAGLIMDKKGNLYGTTSTGGANILYVNSAGTVFKLEPGGTETVLYSFCSQNNCTDGAGPQGSLIRDKKGNLYGTTYGGGANAFGGGGGGGTVFKVEPGGTETVLYSFCSQTNCTDGSLPKAGLIMGSAGTLYGTTQGGGSNIDLFGAGTIFKVEPGGTETVLYPLCSQANCTDGVGPQGGLIMDSAGNLYGTTASGGEHSGGAVFKLPPGGGAETWLLSFCSTAKCRHGATPLAG